MTRDVVVDRGALSGLPAMLSRLGQFGRVQIVADQNTMAAAGRQATEVLRSSGVAVEDPVVLTELPRMKPRAETASAVSGRLADSGALPISIGSGVLNDITKYASEVAGLPYVSIATAASMDGYAASGAAMLEGGFKRTLACAPPIGVIADLDVIAKAPARMAAWGYADLAGKVVAGADWVLADALGEEPLNPSAFGLVQDNLLGWLAGPEQVAAASPDALRGLVEGLLVSGFAMQAHGNSRPASGSEHLLSHLWEMERLTVDGEPVAHGACVGVGTIALLALYEWFLGEDVASAASRRAGAPPANPVQVEAEIASAFSGPGLAESARSEMAAKAAGADRRRARLETLGANWPILRRELQRTLVPAGTMESWLEACGAASHPADLSITMAKLARDYRRARLIRRRYTILDCIDDLGWLDRATDELFAPRGFWGRRAPDLRLTAGAAH